MKRTANAHWEGNMKEGKGDLTTQTTTLNHTQYSFNSRFADGIGTNPEELLGAAHAGCYTMALSAFLQNEGITAGTLDTKAIVELDAVKLAITNIQLELTASAIDGVSEEQFTAIAKAAKENCPVSKALAGTEIGLTVSYKQAE
ncbi:OsmC family peroxiredoxin [Chitinophaga sedimenti]|uniref:OsmC family peroxiredoxin n=1 Tax=Chitinophaga sedimenti TaxID=2033606 RepID=UPI0020040AAF|nr:OsmC family peroxiredoxin [Chitinophaga sedimenti]MCK7556058.1 OsmC family peroxiredoxin [Chitinophaga sedimenti]